MSHAKFQCLIDIVLYSLEQVLAFVYLDGTVDFSWTLRHGTEHKCFILSVREGAHGFKVVELYLCYKQCSLPWRYTFPNSTWTWRSLGRLWWNLRIPTKHGWSCLFISFCVVFYRLVLNVLHITPPPMAGLRKLQATGQRQLNKEGRTAVWMLLPRNISSKILVQPWKRGQQLLNKNLYKESVSYCIDKRRFLLNQLLFGPHSTISVTVC